MLAGVLRVVDHGGEKPEEEVKGAGGTVEGFVDASMSASSNL